MIAVIDYRAGNLKSVQRALVHIGEHCVVTSDPTQITRADRVVFPGVGAAGSAMESLRELGLVETVRSVVDAGVPFLGICLGTQIIFEKSEEGGVLCLGVLRGVVKRFPRECGKIPHMGWNTIMPVRRHPLLEGIGEDDWFYFVHSYYPEPADETDVVARTSYGIEFASVVGRGNVFATQFHPEKSGEAGLRILRNFCSWDGST